MRANNSLLVDSRDPLLISLDGKQAHLSIFVCLILLLVYHFVDHAVEGHRSLRGPVGS